MGGGGVVEGFGYKPLGVPGSGGHGVHDERPDVSIVGEIRQLPHPSLLSPVFDGNRPAKPLKRCQRDASRTPSKTAWSLTMSDFKVAARASDALALSRASASEADSRAISPIAFRSSACAERASASAASARASAERADARASLTSSQRSAWSVWGLSVFAEGLSFGGRPPAPGVFFAMMLEAIWEACSAVRRAVPFSPCWIDSHNPKRARWFLTVCFEHPTCLDTWEIVNIWAPFTGKYDLLTGLFYRKLFKLI